MSDVVRDDADVFITALTRRRGLGVTAADAGVLLGQRHGRKEHVSCLERGTRGNEVEHGHLTAVPQSHVKVEGLRCPLVSADAVLPCTPC